MSAARSFRFCVYGRPDEEVPLGAAPLNAETRYVLQGPPHAIDAICEIQGDVCTRLDAHLALVEFGNAVGFFEFPGIGRIEVRSGKWRQADFDAMLSELTRLASGLPFAHGTPAALPYERSVTASEDVLYHAFTYLRHIILSEAAKPSEQLIPALRVILQEPHQRMLYTRRDVPVALVSRVDDRTLTQMVAAGWGGGVERGGSSASTGRLRLPETVNERHVLSTHDTPENRFVLSFLSGIESVLDRMRRRVRQPGVRAVFRQRVEHDADEMERRVRPHRRNGLWSEVGRMTHLPAGSTVLQRRRGYREVFRQFVHWRLATRVPFAKELVERFLEGKDIAELYELWCYFTVVQEMENILGRPSEASAPRVGAFSVTVDWECAVTWKGRAAVLYNASFSRLRSRQYSYSAHLRPDIAIWVHSGPNEGLHLMDAKFKLEKLDRLLPAQADDVDEEEDVEERRGTFKRGDLYKMHAYRDAIPEARSVRILYPGSEDRFFSPKQGHTASLSELDGVGALPLRPREEPLYLQQTLKRLLAGSAPGAPAFASEPGRARVKE